MSVTPNGMTTGGGEVQEHEDYSSPRPWTYHTAPSRHGVGKRDWIEDAAGNIMVENVGHLDGPLICRAVNASAQADQ